MGVKEMGTKETGARETEGKAEETEPTGAQDRQETGGKGDMLIGKREMDNRLPADTTAGQNATERIQRKNYSEVVIGGLGGERGCLWGTRQLGRPTES